MYLVHVLSCFAVLQHPEIGQRAMRVASIALLEGGDADGLAEGEEVTLKNWGNVKVTKLDKDDSGKSSQSSLSQTKCFSAYPRFCHQIILLASTSRTPSQLSPGALRRFGCCTMSLTHLFWRVPPFIRQSNQAVWRVHPERRLQVHQKAHVARQGDLASSRAFAIHMLARWLAGWCLVSPCKLHFQCIYFVERGYLRRSSAIIRRMWSGCILTFPVLQIALYRVVVRYVIFRCRTLCR